MSDENDNAQAIVDSAAATAPVQRPDTPVDPAARVDSLGRSMANKRGRKPGSQAASGGSAAPRAAKPDKSPADELTDAFVGKAIAGAFSLISLPMGGHWRLFPQEEKEIGECFGPFARLIGPDKFGNWLIGLTAAPTAIGIIGPRIAVSTMIYRKQLPKEDGRQTLLMFKASMVAEGLIDIDRQVKESETYLREVVNAGAVAVAKNEAAKQTTVMQSNGAITPAPESKQ